MLTAIITGACSGIGLSLTRHLLRTGAWKVVLVDIHPAKYDAVSESLSATPHLFVACDVSQWDHQRNMFAKAFKWNDGHRIDFIAMNAGIDDMALGRRHPFAQLDEPIEPDLRVLHVNLNAVIYGTHLFTHYANKTRTLCELCDDFQPKAIVTASMAAQYPFYSIPQYAASKHGVLGWVRSVAPSLWQTHRIALNCIMPGTVDTGLIPQTILAQWPTNYLTPMATILQAFDELLSEDQDRHEASQNKARIGCSIEASQMHLYYRDHVSFADEAQEWIVAQSMDEGILGKITAQYYTQ